MLSGGGFQTDLSPRASQDQNHPGFEGGWLQHCRQLQRWLNLNHFPRIGIRHEGVKESNSLREHVSESYRVSLCTIISFVRLWEGEEFAGGGVYCCMSMQYL